MLKVISFRLSGEFASFRDPSVTSNQLVYLIPSKTALVGIIGAILGVERGHDFESMYGKAYLDLYSKTRIGIELLSEPSKFTFFTNHRSLKEDKTKPYKTEVLMSPSYTAYVSIEDEQTSRSFLDALENNSFVYPPYLGHAYCPARISDVVSHSGEYFDGLSYLTSSVILDESETYNNSFKMEIEPRPGTDGVKKTRLIVERHIHHFFENGKFERRVFKHWIPVGGTPYSVEMNDRPKLSRIMRLANKVTAVCLY